MLNLALILFAIAAVGGLALLIQHLKSHAGAPQPALGLALVHGAFAASGLVVLVIAFLQGTVKGLGVVSLVIFVVAALGGFYLFAQHAAKKQLPKQFLFVHGGAAVVGFVLLLAYKFGM